MSKKIVTFLFHEENFVREITSTTTFENLQKMINDRGISTDDIDLKYRSHGHLLTIRDDHDISVMIKENDNIMIMGRRKNENESGYCFIQ